MTPSSNPQVGETGIAGIPIKPHKPRCYFGRSHGWIEDHTLPEKDGEHPAQCMTCGSVSSNHPAAKGDPS